MSESDELDDNDSEDSKSVYSELMALKREQGLDSDGSFNPSPRKKRASKKGGKYTRRGAKKKMKKKKKIRKDGGQLKLGFCFKRAPYTTKKYPMNCKRMESDVDDPIFESDDNDGEGSSKRKRKGGGRDGKRGGDRKRK